ncbi:hypothetical protein Bca4012_019624 [Brassica carinata]|uniref:Uncharacterized protein n=1 Tax=Brassica carinata TaxID=52824 RepID=A0A8X7WJL6_BRACI|nr:hypothetical protein Bca52824_001936 [Brassica carinata]
MLMLQALLNGGLYSPYHLVMVEKKTRYPTAMFAVPKPGVIIDSPEDLVDEEHPRVFKPFEYSEFLNFFHSKAGRKAESALHAFWALMISCSLFFFQNSVTRRGCNFKRLDPNKRRRFAPNVTSPGSLAFGLSNPLYYLSL